MFHEHFRRIRTAVAPVLIAMIFSVLVPMTADAQLPFLQQRRSAITDVGMGLLSANEVRSIIDLNGRWEYREADSETWYDISVPSSWKGVQRVFFKREFTLPAEQFRARAFQLVALSVSNYCEISINGQFIGKHSGLTSFSFNISSGVLKPGVNTIELFVHNELTTYETLPLYEQLWSRMNYGGIVHDIALVARRGVWVQETYLNATGSGDGKPGSLLYRAFLSSGQLPKTKSDSAAGVGEFGRSIVSHQIELLDGATMQVLASSEVQRLTVESDRLREVEILLSLGSVKMWSPETPNLYLLRQRTMQGATLLDESFVNVGFKNFQIRGTDLYLNGEKYFLKTLTYMEDSPRHGRTLSIDEMEKDVLLLKNLGANSVRLFAGSVHPYFLSLCDRYGLLVLQDIPMTYAPSSILEKPGILTTARNTAREMLARDNWHPSFAALGIGQGIAGDRGGWESFLKELVISINKQHKMLLYASFFGVPPQIETGTVDILGIDAAPGRESQITAMLESVDPSSYGVPVIVSSLMYPVEINNYNGYSDWRSIDAQGQFYLNIYRTVRQKEYAGIVVHSFSDWAVSRPIMTVDRIHQFTGTAGIVDRFRQKRLAYDVLKASFNNEKPPVLISGSFDEEHPIGFVAVGIIVIFLFALVYNVFRRFRENVVRSFLRPYNFFADVRDQRMLSIFQTSMVGFLGALAASLLYANLLYHWRMNPHADNLLAQFIHANWLKQWINYAAWNPFENILLTTAILFIAMLLFTLLLRLAGVVSRAKVLLFDAYSVAMWSVLPMIMLAPFGMVLYRVMNLAVIEVLSLLLYAIFHVWVLSRLLKGTAIVFDVRPVYFYIGGFVVLAGGAAFWLMSLNTNYDLFAYLRYFAGAWLSASGYSS